MDIIEFFDPQVTKHLRAYKYLEEHGSWPRGFIDEDITFSPIWQVVILSKIADAHIENLLQEEKTPLKKIPTRYMKGQPCLVCAEGYYEETSLHNDWGGTFTCSSCGHRTESHIPILQPGEPINATSLDMDREVQSDDLIKKE